VRRGNLSPHSPAAPTPKKRPREEEVYNPGNESKKPISSSQTTLSVTNEFNSDTFGQQMQGTAAARNNKLVKNHLDPPLQREKPNELMERFFMSQHTEERPEEAAEKKTSIITTEADTRLDTLFSVEAAIEELENQLPIVDHAEAMQEWLKTQEDPKEDESVEKGAKVELTEQVIEKLNEGELEHVSGLTDSQGIFREWQYIASLVSLKGEILYTLPYCVIDEL